MQQVLRLSKKLFVGAGSSTARSERLRIRRKQAENEACYRRGVEDAAPYDSNFGLFDTLKKCRSNGPAFFISIVPKGHHNRCVSSDFTHPQGGFHMATPYFTRRQAYITVPPGTQTSMITGRIMGLRLVVLYR